MTKADLVEAIHEQVGLSKKESADIVELVFDTMKDTLEKAEKIKISGFGNFEVRDKPLPPFRRFILSNVENDAAVTMAGHPSSTRENSSSPHHVKFL